jgi:protein-disulfide isomerase
MERKTELWIVGGVVLGIVVIAILAFIFSGNAAPPAFNATVVPAISSSDWVRGDTSANVSVIEYGDFQCPACGEYEPLVQQLTKQYGSSVEFVFRNFPLFQIHQDAMIAAQAAEAAGVQGKYWEMHDLLYQKQSEWSAEPAATVVAKYFNGYAQTLGLDVTKFDADINSTAVKNKIQHDIDTGNAAQIDHTPTFFINLAQIQNPNNLAEFQADIEAALASSTPAAH